MRGGTAFVNSINPGIYPTGPAANAAPGTRAMADAVHKEQIVHIEIFAGVKQSLKNMILKAVEQLFFAFVVALATFAGEEGFP